MRMRMWERESESEREREREKEALVVINIGQKIMSVRKGKNEKKEWERKNAKEA